MADVIDLNRKREETQPHSSGIAMCLYCKHEWMAVVPSIIEYFECPMCKKHTGIYKYPYGPLTSTFVCNCDNSLFYVTEEGIMCPKCGVTHGLKFI